MSMSLESGKYIIASKSQGGYVGRRDREDRSLLPKQVVTLPQGVQAPKWELEKLRNGRYIMKIGGSPTVAIEGKLFAIVVTEQPPSEWKIEPQFHLGENTYSILKEDRSEGWVVEDDEPYQQILVRPLIVGPSDPPFYPPNQLFVIRNE